jgi:hypothetical protein
MPVREGPAGSTLQVFFEMLRLFDGFKRDGQFDLPWREL